MEELNQALYNPSELIQDKEYVMKKLGFSEKEFDHLMEMTPKSHLDYPNSMWLINVGIKIKRFFEI